MMDSALPVVMGIVNATPDSFSDGGRSAQEAIDHATKLMADGADIIDVGGESTRPGAQRISPEEELARVLPVVEALGASGVPLSIDTMNASTARACVAAGARIVNDVSGGLGDPAMGEAIAELGVDVVVMHQRTTASDESDNYGTDPVDEILKELSGSVDSLLAKGVKPSQIIVDPGIGFTSTREVDWQLVGSLERIQSLGYRVLMGVSRKRMLGGLPGADLKDPDWIAVRDEATAVLTALMTLHGVWGVRVHDVRSSCLARDVAWRMLETRRSIS